MPDSDAPTRVAPRRGAGAAPAQSTVSYQRHRRSGLGITAKIFLSTVGVVVVAIGGAVVLTSIRANALMEKAVREAFAATQHVFDNIQHERYDKLERLNALVAEDPTFKAVVLETDDVTRRDDIARRRDSLGADLVIATDKVGALLARTDDAGRRGESLADWPLVSRALEGRSAAGLVAQGGKLYHAVALPIGTGGEDLAGVLVSGYLLDDRLAAEMKKITGTEVAFVTEQQGRPSLAASTLSGREEVGSVLAFAAQAGGAGPDAPSNMDIGGASYVGRVMPLVTLTGERAGSLIAFRSIAHELANLRELRLNILLIGLVALLVALLVSFVVARRMTGPLVALAGVAVAVTDGKYDVEVPGQGGDEVGALAAAIRAMVQELKEKADLERYLADIGVVPSDARTSGYGATGAGRGVTGAVRDRGREPAVGEVFAGRYEILEVIASGGMGTVYKAHDRDLDDVVALKTIRREAVGDNPEVTDRFKREIKLARRATHRNILRTYDFGDAGGVQYLTMEYVKGTTLRDLVQKQPDVPLGIALRIAKQVCKGLHAAHAAGVIHRDVKTQNIIIQPNGDLKIMDFGIARPVEAPGLTASGVILGTPEFMAPEQALGREADARSDVYAAGCVFYELFAGVTPFSGANTLEILMKHLHEEPRPLRAVKASIPAEIELIVACMLEKDPAERYQTFAVVHSMLAAVPVPAAPSRAA